MAPSWEHRCGRYRLFKSTRLALGIQRTYIAGSSCGIFAALSAPGCRAPCHPANTKLHNLERCIFRFLTILTCFPSPVLCPSYLLRMGCRGRGSSGDKMQDGANKGKLKRKKKDHNTDVCLLSGIHQAQSNLPRRLPSAQWMRSLIPTCPRIQALLVAVYSW